MRRQRRVTSKDVAERAGVSAATVSAVLNNARGNVRVSPATRDRIERIASELGYSPNRVAQALRRRQSGVICFVPMAVKAERHPFDIPVQTLLGSYVSRAALSHQFHVIEVPAGIAAGSANDLSGFVSDLHADGVIFHGAKTTKHVQAILDLGIPAVQLMRPHAVPGTHTVTVDPEPGFAAAIDHLLELGHRNIAFVGTLNDHPNDTIRHRSFLRSMESRNIVVPPAYLVQRGRYSIADGAASTRALLELSPPPTAIVAAGDVLALGALHALYAARVRVPEDVSLMSYDDAFAESLYPPLTSMSQPFQEVADRAMSLIARVIKSDSDSARSPAHHILPSRLIVRASTGPARREALRL